MDSGLRGKVAIVTGAGGGLGRSHALALAKEGARVVVNDLGNPESDAAERVADEIRSSGGDATSSGASVTSYAQVERMVADTVAKWGKVDILVNNAGILRDKSFAKMTLDDFRLVVDVHLMGSVYCTKAVWDLMRAQNYGRIVMTTSSVGLYGNFGQANYGAAKMALVGLMQTLALEGAKNNVRVNCLAPTAATAMTEGVLPEDAMKLLTPDRVSPGLLALVGDDAPTRTILLAGAGSFEQAHITMTKGIFVGNVENAAEQIATRFGELADRAGETIPGSAFDQYQLECPRLPAIEEWTDMRDAVIVSTARTPIGRAYRGSFNATSPLTLAAHAVRHAVQRSGLEPAEIEDCLLGCSMPQGAQQSKRGGPRLLSLLEFQPPAPGVRGFRERPVGSSPQ